MKPKSTDAPKTKTTRCAIYTRVSTDQQAEVEFNSCDAQEDRIRSFITSQEGFSVAQVYSDPGFTGANTARPGLQQIISDVQAGKLDMVITYKIDRLTRSPRDFYQLIELFEAHNTGYISVTERFDTATPAGRLLRNIMLTFAQFERELASERIRDKFAQRAKRGLYNGGRPPYGYLKEKGHLVLNPRSAPVVRFIFEKFAETRSVQQVAAALRDKWHDRKLSDSFVCAVLQSPAAAGKVPYKGTILPGRHEAIISEDLFNLVRTIQKESPFKERQANPTYHHLPYAGIIQCRECHSIMSPTFTDKKGPNEKHRYFYYRCTATRHKGWNACSSRQISAARLEHVIHQHLLRLSKDPVHLRQMLFSLKNAPEQPELTGVEPPHDLDRLTPEMLQNSLQRHIENCARKTGIEKALAVRRGVEKIYYSKDTITVRFKCVSDSDGKPGDSSLDAAASPCPPPTVCSPARKTERPVSKLETGPTLKLERLKKVELIGIEPTTSSLRTTRSPS